MMRSLVPTTVACLLLAQSICTKAEAASINLTQGQWEVTGADSNTSWSGSKLLFSTQTQNGADFNITGYFDWSSNGTPRGRELFSGTYTASGFLNVSGTQLINPVGIVLANYQAEVQSSSQIINGTWGGVGVLNGGWSATNASAISVPEPFTVIGSLIGGTAALRMRKKLKSITK
jgi:hypothetical protein